MTRHLDLLIRMEDVELVVLDLSSALGILVISSCLCLCTTR